MDVQEIEVTIEHGKVVIHVRGVKGETCLELTKDLEAALGGLLLERELTPEAQELPNPLEQKRQLKNGG
jgi:hypothetical protein